MWLADLLTHGKIRLHVRVFVWLTPIHDDLAPHLQGGENQRQTASKVGGEREGWGGLNNSVCH